MARERPTIGSEAELCAAFIAEFNALPGWVCYPETAGFDVLVVHETGWQIGVEAKLKLNAKVADQILPGDWESRYGSPGPDHRLVIVGDITEASLGIQRLLEMCGVAVLRPNIQRAITLEDGERIRISFDIRYWLQYGTAWRNRLFDWNPCERCQVPIVVPDVPAGVPSPLRLTPWKEAALQVLIQLRQQGYITTKQIAEAGISPTAWTRGGTSWLDKGTKPGQWVETDRLPAFDKQHPEAYQALLERQQKAASA